MSWGRAQKSLLAGSARTA
uniref:Uncharacterized protein n=1 Tax=Anguilla anguilla TaxID=7936 RepID=A0A0E9T3T9_ANGAN